MGGASGGPAVQTLLLLHGADTGTELGEKGKILMNGSHRVLSVSSCLLFPPLRDPAAEVV